MSVAPLQLAILAESVRQGLDYIRLKWPEARVYSAQGHAVCEVFGVERYVKVHTRTQTLRGTELMGFEILAGCDGQLIPLAASRVRH